MELWKLSNARNTKKQRREALNLMAELKRPLQQQQLTVASEPEIGQDETAFLA